MHSADLSLILEALGNSPTEVAQTLRGQQIQGVRNTARFLNPVCRYVEAAFSLDILSVDLLNYQTLRIRCPDGTSLTAELPDSIKDFLQAFNRGAYPEIERVVD
jgi:hypothetical protein